MEKIDIEDSSKHAMSRRKLMKRLPKIHGIPNIEENSKVKLSIEDGLKRGSKKPQKKEQMGYL